MTREEHLKAIYIIGRTKRGKTEVLLMLCSGPECGGAELFVRCAAARVADVVAEANAHIDEAARS